MNYDSKNLTLSSEVLDSEEAAKDVSRLNNNVDNIKLDQELDAKVEKKLQEMKEHTKAFEKWFTIAMFGERNGSGKDE